MSLKNQFKLEALEKPKSIDPVSQRRQKFIATIDRQLARLSDKGHEMNIKSSWLWQSNLGEWYISPRYGRIPLELAQGLNAIKCVDVADVAKNLQKLKALADEGKLDDLLKEAATTIRSRFTK